MQAAIGSRGCKILSIGEKRTKPAPPAYRIALLLWAKAAGTSNGEKTSKDTSKPRIPSTLFAYNVAYRKVHGHSTANALGGLGPE